jgi:multiple sugar transport system ATP-binding protein
MQVGVSAAPDRPIDVAIDLERTHLFDKVSGEAVS